MIIFNRFMFRLASNLCTPIRYRADTFVSGRYRSMTFVIWVMCCIMSMNNPWADCHTVVHLNTYTTGHCHNHCWFNVDEVLKTKCGCNLDENMFGFSHDYTVEKYGFTYDFHFMLPNCLCINNCRVLKYIIFSANNFFYSIITFSYTKYVVHSNTVDVVLALSYSCWSYRKLGLIWKHGKSVSYSLVFVIYIISDAFLHLYEWYIFYTYLLSSEHVFNMLYFHSVCHYCT